MTILMTIDAIKTEISAIESDQKFLEILFCVRRRSESAFWYCVYSYVDLERSNGGDVKENWRWNVGIRNVF